MPPRRFIPFDLISLRQGSHNKAVYRRVGQGRVGEGKERICIRIEQNLL